MNKENKVEEKELFFTKERYESVKQKIAEYNKKACTGNTLISFFK